MLATRSVLLLLKNMVFMQINILIVNMLNEFVRKMIEFGFITKKNANQSYFSMVKTTVNSNMQFSRSKMDKEGILRTVFECSNRLNEKSKANVMVKLQPVARKASVQIWMQAVAEKHWQLN